MRIFASLCLAAVLCVPAAAHDYWGNGQEIDPVTKFLCCGQSDCKEVDPASMHVEGDLYRFDDTDLTIPVSRAQPSPDGLVWRCIFAGEIRCLFISMPGA